MSRRDEPTEHESGSDDIKSDDAMNAFDDTPYTVEWTQDGHVSEDVVYAWLDGALVADDAARVDAHVQSCAVCSATVAEARGFIAASVRIMNAADLWPANAERRVVQSEDVARAASSIVALADRAQTSHVRAEEARVSDRINLSSRAGGKQNKSWYQQSWLQAAAALLVVAMGSYLGTRDRELLIPATQVSTASDSTAGSSNAAAPSADTLRDRSVAPTPPIVSVSPKRAAKPASKDKRDVASAPKATEPVTLNIPATPPAPTNSQPTRPQALAPVVTTAAVDTTPPRRLGFSVTVVPATDMPAPARAISGRVRDRATNTPIAAAYVVVPGTSISALTDTAGNFTVRGIPDSTKAVDVRRLGYVAARISLDTLDNRNSVEVTMENQPMRLDAVSVTSVGGAARESKKRSANPNAPQLLCLVSESDVTGALAPLVRNIRAKLQDSGDYQATVVGWPKTTDSKKVKLMTSDDGSMRGRLKSGRDSLVLEFVQRDGNWFSASREYRGANVRAEDVRLKNDPAVARCR